MDMAMCLNLYIPIYFTGFHNSFSQNLVIDYINLSTVTLQLKSNIIIKFSSDFFI